MIRTTLAQSAVLSRGMGNRCSVFRGFSFQDEQQPANVGSIAEQPSACTAIDAIRLQRFRQDSIDWRIAALNWASSPSVNKPSETMNKT